MSQSSCNWTALSWALLVVGSALLYGYTLAPGLLWGDGALFQISLATGALTSHPVWGVLGRLWNQPPWRPANEFFLWPPKRSNVGARRFAETPLQVLPADALIAADWTLFTPLVYLQAVEGQRPDVRFLEMSSAAVPMLVDHGRELLVHVADDYAPYYALDELLASLELQPLGTVFRLSPRRPTA